MVNKSQQRKERHEKRRKEKRKRQEQAQARKQSWDQPADNVQGANARHRQRLLKQIPAAWPGERAEDAAIVDDAVLATLPAESAGLASAVRAAVQDALEARGDDALKRVSAIPRGSEFSDWRLFVRGLVDWLAGMPEAAGEAWQRLDLERRPGRIATAMMVALRSDLEQAIPFSEGQPQADAAASPPWGHFDAQQLYHAKLLRRVRFDRAAVRVAETTLNIPEESKDLHIGPRKIKWLRQFIAEYQDTEPDLTAALAQAALRRAYAQHFSNLFDEAAGAFPGPRHDRRNRLLRFFYYLRFNKDPEAARVADRALDEYLHKDLPGNEALPAPLRGAIASQIHLKEATSEMRPVGGGMFGRMFAPSEDAKFIRDHLLQAAHAAPGNKAVYKAHADWINAKLDDERLTKPKRAPLEAELADVMQRWSQGLPDEAEPRLWLVDHLLENDQLEEARPHVEFLSASRLDDPRVRAMPWKWQLLEAMRLCRRKAWLGEVPARLTEAEALWPAWLPKQWLPYLRAAVTLRTGNIEAFEAERQEICGASGLVRDSLADACLMLGAAQQMRATATELKPLREALDLALKKIHSTPFDVLIEAGACFWDLHRAQLLYPAYRMHGKIIGTALVASLVKAPQKVLDGINDERMQKAVLWGSEYQFWPRSYGAKPPAFFSNPAIQSHPVFIAAKLNAMLKDRYFHWGAKEQQGLGPPLRQAAASQRDAYYRHWFIQLADQLEEAQTKEFSRFKGFPFGDLFGFGADDDDFDPDCNCPSCTAAREKHEKRAARPGRI